MLILAILIFGSWGVAMSSDWACDPRGMASVCTEQSDHATRYEAVPVVTLPPLTVRRFGVEFADFQTLPAARSKP